MSEATIYKVLKNVVGSENVSDEPAICWAYSADASVMEPTPPSIVIRPGNAEEGSKIVKLANVYKVPVIPSGGRSSLCHAGIPALGGGILIDMTRMNKIRIHEDKQLVTVEAGCTFSRLNEELYREGLITGTPGPFGGVSATIGGALSVGMFSSIGAPLYGPFAERVTGVEVVLPTGEIIRTGAGANPANEMVDRYCNGGDFTGLFLCSHGTLGVITKATLKIRPKYEAEVYINIAFDDLEKASQAAIKLVETEYVELVWQYDKGAFQAAGISPPPESVLYLILCGPKEDIDRRKKVVEKIMTEYGGKIMPDAWKMVQSAEDVKKHGVYHESMFRFPEWSGYIPSYRVPDFLRASREFFEKHSDTLGKYKIMGAATALYSRNCVNFNGAFAVLPPYTEDSGSVAHRLRLELWEIFVEMGEAPYWTGMTLSEPLPWRLGPYYKLFKTLKEALDPNNIMNPGMLRV